MKELFAQAKELIEHSRNILLAAHDEPDSDAVGSLLAMKLGLEKINKKASIYLPDKIPAGLNFLPRLETLKTQPALSADDLVIGLDYGHFQRLKLDETCLKTAKILTIDHHLIGSHLGLKIVENECSSTSELVYQFLMFLGVPITYEIATCLLAGIYSDTGSFRYPNTTARTLKIAGELLAKGAPLQKIVKLSNGDDLSINLYLWIEAFKNLDIDLDSGLVSSLIAYGNLVEAKGNFSGSTIGNFLSAAPEIKLALLCIQKQAGRTDCSLRSQNNRGINVAAIAQQFGGGGHKLAAGFQTADSPQEVVAKIKKLALNNFSTAGKEV